MGCHFRKQDVGLTTQSVIILILLNYLSHLPYFPTSAVSLWPYLIGLKLYIKIPINIHLDFFYSASHPLNMHQFEVLSTGFIEATERLSPHLKPRFHNPDVDGTQNISRSDSLFQEFIDDTLHFLRKHHDLYLFFFRHPVFNHNSGKLKNGPRNSLPTNWHDANSSLRQVPNIPTNTNWKDLPIMMKGKRITARTDTGTL